MRTGSACTCAGGHGIKLWWKRGIIMQPTWTQWKCHIGKGEGIHLCSLSSQKLLTFIQFAVCVCTGCPVIQLQSIFLYPGWQQVGAAGSMAILPAGTSLFCLSGLRSKDATFAPHLLLEEKVVSDQYLGKCNICVYVLFMMGWNFTLCCKPCGMCLPWHFLLLPSAELLPSIQISIHVDLVHRVIYYLWRENMAGAAALASSNGFWSFTGGEGGKCRRVSPLSACSTGGWLTDTWRCLLAVGFGPFWHFLIDCSIFFLIFFFGVEWQDFCQSFWDKTILCKVIFKEMSALLLCSLAFIGVVGKLHCE